MSKKLRTETLCIHGGYKASNGEAQVLPITQSTTFRHDSPEHLADLFDLKELGWIYSRIANPTVSHLEEKKNKLEGGVGALAFGSGQAAVTATLLTLCQKGDHVIASTHLYGGTVNLFKTSLKRLGIEVTFVEPTASYEEIEVQIKEKTKNIYGETIGNPNLNV
ncbi:MAG: O-acetylhomoserine aminocarboxypropyltransferase/cysteine synthase [Clostridia bacterium]|nr:O-acetylhomoserine aminocarboxypropyltransferase/cysteine synthase [Clostridia bacterium]